MQKKPEIIVFAGPNGSGKSTIIKLSKVIEPYINADNSKSVLHCSDLEAAQTATKMREESLTKGISFTFETVLSTRRNLDLLIKAKENGYFIRCICDICHIYDNSDIPFRIFKKRKTEYFFWENSLWNKDKIESLTGLQL